MYSVCSTLIVKPNNPINSNLCSSINHCVKSVTQNYLLNPKSGRRYQYKRSGPDKIPIISPSGIQDSANNHVHKGVRRQAIISKKIIEKILKVK